MSDISRLCFGTYRLKGPQLETALLNAWGENIRHFDTAQLYQNEDDVGRVFQQVATEIDPAWITTKYWDSGVSNMECIRTKISGSVARLRGTASRDAIKVRVLLHHPADSHVWFVLEEMLHDFEIDAIGVANHNVESLESLIRNATERPCVNQIEVHPKLPQDELHELMTYCVEHNIPVEAHSVMIRGLYWDSFRHSELSPPQHLLHFALSQSGVERVCISTTNRIHLKELIGTLSYNGESSTVRLYPLQFAPKRLGIDYSPDSLTAQIQCDMHTFARGELDKVSDAIYYMPSVKSKTSDIAREVAFKLYRHMVVDDAACFAKFHDLTKPLRKFVSDRVVAQSEAKAQAGKTCCVRRGKTNQADEISDDIINPVPMPVIVPPRDYLEPFFTHLRRNEPWTGDKEFFRGALFEDGRMDLCKQVVGPDHVEELCRSVAKNTQIKHFLLGNNIAFDKRPELAHAMAELMEDNDLPIETWYLAGNCINPEAIAILATGLMHNTVAKALWLKRNPIGPRGALSIQRLLNHNQTLTILDLDNCGLLDDGVRTLSEARDCHIKHLYIDANGITAVGACYLAGFIQSNRNVLKSFYASINRFGDDGVQAIALAFKGSTTLKRLSMGSNRITDAAADVIVNCALNCPKLVLLDVGCYKSTFDLGEKPNFLKDPRPWLRLIETHAALKHLDLLRNNMTIDDARQLVAAAKQRHGLNVYAAMNNVTRDQLCYVEGIPDKADQKVLKHPKRVIHIDSMYRNKM